MNNEDIKLQRPLGSYRKFPFPELTLPIDEADKVILEVLTDKPLTLKELRKRVTLNSCTFNAALIAMLVEGRVEVVLPVKGSRLLMRVY